MRLLPALVVGLATFSACARNATRSTSQQGSALSSDRGNEEPVMCMWNAYGKRQYTCSSDDLTQAQKTCDEKATDMRKEPSTCSCTSDPNYIQHMCDDGVEPPVTSGWTRN
jgi:hypothetical protein